MKIPRSCFTRAKARMRRLSIALTLLGLSGCAFFKPVPPTLPKGALAVIQAPVAAKVLLLDDGGNKAIVNAIIPAGWSVMYLAPEK